MSKVRKIHVRPQSSSVIQPGESTISSGLRVAAYARYVISHIIVGFPLTTRNSRVPTRHSAIMANSLSALSALMDQDTKAAKRMIADMSGYLRDNFYDLSGRKNLMIPFPEELERLEHYLAIERIRFPDINVDYWLEVTEFEIPAMTLQPLVENAIKYGICKKSNYSEGNIEIRSSQTLEAYLVIIEDDGAGFDEKQLSMERKDEETKQHIGIRNTAKRLELMCEGSLTIHSTPGRGTTCEITIPKQKV